MASGKRILLGLVWSVQVWSCLADVDNYLKEQPDFLTPCRIHEKPQNTECFSSALESIFRNWKDGIPGVKQIPSIDPFRVKRVRLSQKNDNMDIKIELRNMSAYGFSNVKALRTVINDKDYTFKVQLHLPLMSVLSDYKVKGRILLLNLDAQGQLATETTALDYFVAIKSDLIQHDGEYFLNITSFKTTVKDIGSYHVNFTNLFGGNKELEDSANELFNLSWRELFDVLRPTVEQTFDAIVANRYKKIFNYMPARFLIADLP